MAAAGKPCTCGTCASCKTKKNPNMKRDQSLTTRKKNSIGKLKGKK